MEGSVSLISPIKKVNPDASDLDIIREAADLIKKGGVVLFPTRCLYGLGADAFNADAVVRIFEIKQRPDQNPILLLIHDERQLEGLVTHIPHAASRIMARFWPGKVTLVFEAKPGLPPNLTAGTGKIGVRLCGHPMGAALTKAVNGPLTGTSANISGQPGCSRVSDLETRIRERVDLILDAGPLKGGAGSTVVDVTGGDVKVLREGAVSCAQFFET